MDHLKSRAQADASDPSLLAEAQSRFDLELAQIAVHQAAIVRRRRTAHYLAVRARAQLLLLRAALVEVALGRSPTLFDDKVYSAKFNEHAVLGLQRHGFPWGALLKLAHQPGLAPDPNDDFFLGIAGEKRETLSERLNQLTGEARQLVKMLCAASAAARGG
jgi:hypothetical protein